MVFIEKVFRGGRLPYFQFFKIVLSYNSVDLQLLERFASFLQFNSYYISMSFPNMLSAMASFIFLLDWLTFILLGNLELLLLLTRSSVTQIF